MAILDHVPHHGETDNRDIHAQKPREISFSGWKQIVVRIVKRMGEHHLGIVAAGVAFNAFLAIFPLIIAAVSLYGLMVDPATLQSHISSLTSMLPESADEPIQQRLQSILPTSDQKLGWGLLVGLVLSLWAANRGTKAMFEGINIAYDTEQKRNFFIKNIVTLLVTVAGLVFGGVCLALIAVFPAITGVLPLPEQIITLIQFAIWPILFVLLIIALGLLYKVAPVRADPQAKWVSVGSVTAAIIWIAASAGFSFFVANFGNYDKTYGSVAAVAVLMLWLFLSSLAVLLGAEINSEVELQTAEDTTTGHPKPMGRRKAFQADHVVG